MASQLLMRSLRLTTSKLSVNVPAMAFARFSHDVAHATITPPFIQRAAPTRSLPSGNELIWDDGVAPETCIDFDVPQVSTGRALRWWLGGLSMFALLAFAIKLYNPKGMKRTAERVLPYENAKKALGN
ncbi:hypothetical protein WA158_006478 [Blastocystis sp. Blastoise]